MSRIEFRSIHKYDRQKLNVETRKNSHLRGIEGIEEARRAVRQHARLIVCIKHIPHHIVCWSTDSWKKNRQGTSNMLKSKKYRWSRVLKTLKKTIRLGKNKQRLSEQVQYNFTYFSDIDLRHHV